MPFYIRAGKSLPVTRTEVVARFKRPPAIFHTAAAPNYFRFQISPENEIAIGMNVMDPEESGEGDTDRAPGKPS